MEKICVPYFPAVLYYWYFKFNSGSYYYSIFILLDNFPSVKAYILPLNCEFPANYEVTSDAFISAQNIGDLEEGLIGMLRK